MSRVIVFGLDHRAVGEFDATVTRGYSLNGATTLQGGMTTSIAVPPDALRAGWLQLGRVVYVEAEGGIVPPWAGVIDLPWQASLPVSATVYGAEYLLNLRTPDHETTIRRTFESVFRHLVELANAEEDLFVRVGNLGILPAGPQQLTIKQQPLWGQMNDFCRREGVEYVVRPTYARGEPLTIYLDAGDALGDATGAILADGGGGVQIVDAQLSGSLANRVIGIGKENTRQSRPQTAPYRDDDSMRAYRMRSEVVQFRTLTLISSLEGATQMYLERKARPRLTLTVALHDAELFRFCRPGNWFDVFASNLYLPGGVKGWRGRMRMLQFVFDEDAGTISATMEGLYLQD